MNSYRNCLNVKWICYYKLIDNYVILIPNVPLVYNWLLWRYFHVEICWMCQLTFFPNLIAAYWLELNFRTFPLVFSKGKPYSLLRSWIFTWIFTYTPFLIHRLFAAPSQNFQHLIISLHGLDCHLFSKNMFIRWLFNVLLYICWW